MSVKNVLIRRACQTWLSACYFSSNTLNTRIGRSLGMRASHAILTGREAFLIYFTIGRQVFVWMLLLFSIFTPFNFSFIQCFDSTAVYYSNCISYINWSPLFSVSQNNHSYMCSDCSKEKKLTQNFHANTVSYDELKWLWGYNTRVLPICFLVYQIFKIGIAHSMFSLISSSGDYDSYTLIYLMHVQPSICYQFLAIFTELCHLNEETNLPNQVKFL